MLYKVKVAVTPSNPSNPNERYKTVSYEGVFISKRDRVQKKHIELEVSNWILPPLSKANEGLKMDLKILKIERISGDFALIDNRDKEGGEK